eukprot:CAMPEP_0182418202 /NCGR_PEP_ID=MMETSP1167-20130531/2681_1 /TAXON_ID=2988 /ORGANISM="Mallomonas Sp, Strain CCMP3275" /LENGTH=180 /DNA_ID=CAMNT_0024592289 /DNA_START=37 /DNA_END=579 /DNA_ORIENTATION=+
MTTVAEEGNRRKGAATEDEIRQCALDIKSWFERSSPALKNIPGAEPSDFQRMDKALESSAPEALEILLSVVDGGIWFMEKKLLSVDKIIRLYGQLESSKLWRPELIPFCGDASDMLVIDALTGEVLEWDDQEGLGELMAVSFSGYLEDYRNDLLEGNMDFLDECGVVEKMANRKMSKSKK